MRAELRTWLVISLALVLLAGCGVDRHPADPESDPSPGLTIEEIVDLAELELDDTIVAMIRSELEILKLQKGFYLIRIEEEKYLLVISIGRQNCSGCFLEYGGYVLREDGTVVVTVEELLADLIPDGVYYPYRLYMVRGLGSGELLRVETIAGEVYPKTISKTDMELGSAPVHSGVYQGTGDNQTIRIIREGMTGTFFLGQLADLHYGLNLQVGDAIIFSYVQHQEGRLELVNLQRK